MANAKKRTTFSKLNRENKLREKRMEKAARKEARKLDEGAGSPPPAFSDVPPMPLPVPSDDED